MDMGNIKRRQTILSVLHPQIHNPFLSSRQLFLTFFRPIKVTVFFSIVFASPARYSQLLKIFSVISHPVAQVTFY